MFTSGDASPLNMRRSDSSQSMRSQMWDSSDPTRNPAPLPLPEKGTPVNAVKTQSKISAAHSRLVASSSSRSLATLDQEPQTSLYDLVTIIHSNLEILMKRSQNNARDLGKLRGEVKNPQVVDEIKKILQDTSILQNNGDDDPEKHRQDTEMAMKLDALIKLSQKPSTRAVELPQAHEKQDAILQALTKLQCTLQDNVPFTCARPTVHPEEKVEYTTKIVNVDTSELEATLARLNTQITQKTGELQNIDATLMARRLDLANLESRSSVLQANLAGLLSTIRESREQEVYRMREAESSRKEREDSQRKRKITGRRPLVTLGSNDRRIASLNVPSSPSRGSTPTLTASSPFTKPFQLPNSVNTEGVEIKISPVKPLPLTLRTPPARKASWSKRVSGLFNKENTPDMMSDKRASIRSFRSFSHRF